MTTQGTSAKYTLSSQIMPHCQEAVPSAEALHLVSAPSVFSEGTGWAGQCKGAPSKSVQEPCHIRAALVGSPPAPLESASSLHICQKPGPNVVCSRLPHPDPQSGEHSKFPPTGVLFKT